MSTEMKTTDAGTAVELGYLAFISPAGAPALEVEVRETPELVIGRAQAAFDREDYSEFLNQYQKAIRFKDSIADKHTTEANKLFSSMQAVVTEKTTSDDRQIAIAMHYLRETLDWADDDSFSEAFCSNIGINALKRENSPMTRMAAARLHIAMDQSEKFAIRMEDRKAVEREVIHIIEIEQAVASTNFDGQPLTVIGLRALGEQRTDIGDSGIETLKKYCRSKSANTQNLKAALESVVKIKTVAPQDLVEALITEMETHRKVKDKDSPRELIKECLKKVGDESVSTFEDELYQLERSSNYTVRNDILEIIGSWEQDKRKTFNKLLLNLITAELHPSKKTEKNEYRREPGLIVNAFAPLYPEQELSLLNDVLCPPEHGKKLGKPEPRTIPEQKLAAAVLAEHASKESMENLLDAYARILDHKQSDPKLKKTVIMCVARYLKNCGFEEAKRDRPVPDADLQELTPYTAFIDMAIPFLGHSSHAAREAAESVISMFGTLALPQLQRELRKFSKKNPFLFFPILGASEQVECHVKDSSNPTSEINPKEKWAGLLPYSGTRKPIYFTQCRLASCIAKLGPLIIIKKQEMKKNLTAIIKKSENFYLKKICGQAKKSLGSRKTA